MKKSRGCGCDYKRVGGLRPKGGGLGAVRTRDNGAFYSVSFGEREISDFRRRWPASGLHMDNVWAQFSRKNGDLVDLKCGRGDCHDYDGPALSALVEDMQCAATKKGAKAKAPKEHCRRGR